MVLSRLTVIEFRSSAVPRLVRGIQRSKLRVTFLDPADKPRDGGVALNLQCDPVSRLMPDTG